MRTVKLKSDNTYISSEGITHDKKLLSEILKDEGWKNLSLLSGFSAASIICAPKYRKIGNHVYIVGSISATQTGSVASIPAGYRPKQHCYKLNASSGGTIARVGVTSAGTLFLDWVVNINNGSSVSNPSWIDICIDYLVD